MTITSITSIDDARKAIYGFFKTAMAAKYPLVFPVDITDDFSEKIYWRKSRDEQPQKPFILLDDIVKSRVSKRYESFVRNKALYQRENWRMVVTFAVYTQGNSGDFSQADLDALSYIEYISLLFNSQDTFNTLRENGIIIKETESGNVRDLSSFENTNYSYRYETDIVFEFDKEFTITDSHGTGLQVGYDLKVDNKNNLKISTLITKE